MKLKHPIYAVDLKERVGTSNRYIPENRLPFDRFYLVPPEAMAELRRLVPYCITIPLTLDYAEPLEKLELDLHTLMRHDYRVAVPIHMKSVREKSGGAADRLHPTYMAKSAWWFHPELTSVIPENTSLHTPTETLTPMCLYCVNSLAHIAGECSIGSSACAQNLEIKYKPTDLTAYVKYDDPHTAIFKPTKPTTTTSTPAPKRKAS